MLSHFDLYLKAMKIIGFLLGSMTAALTFFSACQPISSQKSAPQTSVSAPVAWNQQR